MPGRSPKPPVSVVRVDQLRLGVARRIADTDIAVIPVLSGDADSYSSGGPYKARGGQDERNLIIIDTVKGVSRRLLKDDKSSIDNWVLPSTASRSEAESEIAGVVAADDDQQDVIRSDQGMFVALIRSRSAQDERKSISRILVGSLVTGSQHWIQGSFETLDDAWIERDGKVAVLVSDSSDASILVVDPNADFREVRRIAISIAPPDQNPSGISTAPTASR
jgi:hypothetical protein